MMLKKREKGEMYEKPTNPLFLFSFSLGGDHNLHFLCLIVNQYNILLGDRYASCADIRKFKI